MAGSGEASSGSPRDGRPPEVPESPVPALALYEQLASAAAPRSDDQCGHEWAGLRCRLAAGHASVHAARSNGGLISWRGTHDGQRTGYSTEWLDDSGD